MATVNGDIHCDSVSGPGAGAASCSLFPSVPIFDIGNPDEFPPFLDNVSGGSNVTVMPGGSLTITQANSPYRDVFVKNGATLTLSGDGVYHFRTLKLGNNAELLIDAVDDAQITVLRKMTTGSGATTSSCWVWSRHPRARASRSTTARC